MKQSQLMTAGMASILMLGSAPAVMTDRVYLDNDLTNLIPDLYAGMDVVSRELVGLIPSSTRNTSAERAMVGQNIVYPVSPEASLSDITPQMQVPEPADKQIGFDQMSIQHAKKTDFGFVGEEQVGLSHGPGNLTIQADLFAQGLRKLTNEIEKTGFGVAAAGASRAVGTPGTTPFNNNVDATADARKVLDDNGAPASNRSLVISTTYGAQMRKNHQLTKANEAGTTMTLRQGELLDLHDFSIKESAAATSFAHAASGATVTTNGSAYLAGSVVITMSASGIIAGDVITFAGDVNKYVVASVDGAAVTLAKPGLRLPLPASNVTVTVLGNYQTGVGFTQNAMQMVMRAPALPQGGDAAVDSMMLTDPRSGLVFEVRVYAGYRKISYEVATAWGWKNIKAEHTVLLLG